MISSNCAAVSVTEPALRTTRSGGTVTGFGGTGAGESTPGGIGVASLGAVAGGAAGAGVGAGGVCASRQAAGAIIRNLCRKLIASMIPALAARLGSVADFVRPGRPFFKWALGGLVRHVNHRDSAPGMG